MSSVVTKRYVTYYITEYRIRLSFMPMIGTGLLWYGGSYPILRANDEDMSHDTWSNGKFLSQEQNAERNRGKPCCVSRTDLIENRIESLARSCN